MSTTADSHALALKRKLQYADSTRLEPAAKRHSLPSYDPQTPWLNETKPSGAWRRGGGNPAVRASLPLANMVSAVQDLIDPDFDPLTAILDEEPRFLKPLPSGIAPEDLEFLRFRGALSIPESGLRDELLRCYIQWVHSFMPVLNLQEFLRCVAENDPEGNVSLLLFQAVMFVGTAFVDLKHLQAAGFSTRKSARNAFFTRLRLLYSLDCEEDRIVILQTLLLMTYWSDPGNNPQRDIWDWIGVCNTQAQSIGLNRDPSSADMDSRTRRLRTRLWWCLYTRDRLIALGVRRPSQVNEGTSNVPMLKLDDFDFEPFASSVVAIFRCRQLEDVSHQQRLATMFIEKVKLCQCIGRVLFAQYTPSQRQFGATDRTTITIVPRQASESEFTRCSQKLDSWLAGLPKDAQFLPTSKTNFRDGEDVLLLHGAMVRMLYHATSSALHRPWAAVAKDQSKSRIEWRNKARTKMHEAAAGITHIIQGLNQLNLTRFLPQSGVTVILPAAVAHLSNTMSDNPAVRESSMYNFRRCIQVLHGLKDIYPAADMEVANIEAAIKMQGGNSGAFLQIMQYNLDSASKTSSETTPTAQSPHHLNDKPITDTNNSQPPRPRATSFHDQDPKLQQQQRKPRAQTFHEPSRPVFSNDFDNHLPSTPGSNKNTFPSTTNDSPFDFLSLDADLFSNLVSPPSGLTNTNTYMNNPQNTTISPSNAADLDSIDWTQELFRNDDNNLRNHLHNTNDGKQSQTQDLEMHDQEDLFSFALDDDQNNDHDMILSGSGGGSHQRQYSTSSHHHHPPDITGDLDKDLGFQTGDEDMF
ncbi:hypothetical protein N7474_010418 [Penicillium riverlandense]|uniref:uncharacterized protein n=1 Tax=Penicillium riverlandense TaxID=1903569 RepID=UPI00254896B1|nr:uncharacterized protein N7474_010418 [Penicillium riverlandense]KAJ5806826.1 hypothetical protein N7474_010418 [Penicillium riverlandense]